MSEFKSDGDRIEDLEEKVGVLLEMQKKQIALIESMNGDIRNLLHFCIRLKDDQNLTLELIAKLPIPGLDSERQNILEQIASMKKSWNAVVEQFVLETMLPAVHVPSAPGQ